MTTHCADCGAPISEPASTPISRRKPCAACGSTKRTFAEHVSESITLREKLGMKQKRPGHKKPIYESVSGDDLHRKSGQWNKLIREIDRENDRYREEIRNPETGKIIHQCDEPLSKHTRHGSDKSGSSAQRKNA